MSLYALSTLEEVETRLNDLLLWWAHRHDDNLLFLFFDDLKENHTGLVRRIAKFMRVRCDEDAIARVVHTTTHAEMARQSSKFHTRRLATRVAEEVGKSSPSQCELVSRVHKNGGKSGEGDRLLSAEVLQKIDQLWKKIVTRKLGFQNLREMREFWKK